MGSETTLACAPVHVAINHFRVNYAVRGVTNPVFHAPHSGVVDAPLATLWPHRGQGFWRAEHLDSWCAPTIRCHHTLSPGSDGVSDFKPTEPETAREQQRRAVARTRWLWTSANIVLAVVAIWSFTTNLWEAFITLFLASALLQLVWMKRHISEL